MQIKALSKEVAVHFMQLSSRWYMPVLTFLSFLVQKAIRLALLLLTVTTFSFILVSYSPVDPIDAYLGSAILKVSPEQRDIIALRWGLDQPPVNRFMAWGSNVLTGNFGISSIFNEPVLDVIAKRFITSFWLMLAAWTLSGIIGFILGMTAATYESSIIDKAISTYAYTVASTPTFWVGIVMLMVFSVELGWTPVCCAWPLGEDPAQISLFTRIHHLILPAITLSLVGVAQIALHTREKTIELLHSDHALFARAQGESLFNITFRRLLRNISLPAITLQFASLGELFGGAVLTEQVFAYPGLGKATVEAGYRGDVPLLLGIVIFSTIFVFAGKITADGLYRWIDPRMNVSIRQWKGVAP